MSIEDEIGLEPEPVTEELFAQALERRVPKEFPFLTHVNRTQFDEDYLLRKENGRQIIFTNVEGSTLPIEEVIARDLPQLYVTIWPDRI